MTLARPYFATNRKTDAVRPRTKGSIFTFCTSPERQAAV